MIAETLRRERRRPMPQDRTAATPRCGWRLHAAARRTLLEIQPWIAILRITGRPPSIVERDVDVHVGGCHSGVAAEISPRRKDSATGSHGGASVVADK